MTDRELLLSVIKEKPEEDTPRLMYADAIEEEGDSDRAVLIRVQHQISKLLPCELSRRGLDELAELRKEEIRLFLHFAPLWKLAFLSARDIPSQDSFCFGCVERGFLVQVKCMWEWWANYGDALLSQEWVPQVRLSTPPGEFEYKTLGSLRYEFPVVAGKMLSVPRGTSWEDCIQQRWPETKFLFPPPPPVRERYILRVGDVVGTDAEGRAVPVDRSVAGIPVGFVVRTYPDNTVSVRLDQVYAGTARMYPPPHRVRQVQVGFVPVEIDPVPMPTGPTPQEMLDEEINRQINRLGIPGDLLDGGQR